MSFYSDTTLWGSKSNSFKHIIMDTCFKVFSAYLMDGIAFLFTPARFLLQKDVHSLGSSVAYMSPGHLSLWPHDPSEQPFPWHWPILLNSFFPVLIVKGFQISTFTCRVTIMFFCSCPCRKIPWINIYAQVQHDKEQEMIGSVSQSENAPKITLSDFTEPEELLDKELDSRVIGMCAVSSVLWTLGQPTHLACSSESTRTGYSDINVFENFPTTPGPCEIGRIFPLKSRSRARKRWDRLSITVGLFLL